MICLAHVMTSLHGISCRYSNVELEDFWRWFLKVVPSDLRSFEELGTKNLMNGSCAWWVSGPGLFNHLGLW